MQTRSRSGGLSKLHGLQLAFPHDTLVEFAHALYPIFKLTAALGQFLFDFIRAAWDIATNCGGKLYELANVKFVGWHGGALQRKAQIECTKLKVPRMRTNELIKINAFVGAAHIEFRPTSTKIRVHNGDKSPAQYQQERSERLRRRAFQGQQDQSISSERTNDYGK
jgi:hypothetical protein